MSLQQLQTQLRQANSRYRFIAIDPGTDTLGVALCEIDLADLTLHVCDVITLQASRTLGHYPGVTLTHGARLGRLHSHSVNLGQLFSYWCPAAIVSEAPFMGRFAEAFGALVECMLVIRTAVYKYHPFLCLETVDPPTAKKAVGVKAKGSDKLDVQRAVQSDPQIHWDGACTPIGHSEHGYDAIAVAKWKYLTFIGAL